MKLAYLAIVPALFINVACGGSNPEPETPATETTTTEKTTEEAKPADGDAPAEGEKTTTETTTEKKE